jgi:two-component system sensor histidine kinase YesM
VFVLSLLVPITLNGVYFISGFVKLTREKEFLQAQNNVDRIEQQLDEIMGKAVDIANRIYANTRIQQAVATEYGSLLELYNAYNDLYMFDDYLYSYREIAGIRLYVENPTMIDNSYFIVADDDILRENWYETAKALDGRMFWVYRYDAISRMEYVSLVRQIRNITTGGNVGILCVNLDMINMERICTAEFHDTFISLNGSIICPAGSSMEKFSASENWIKTNSFTPRQSVNSIFEITTVIPRETLFAPVYSLMRRALIVLFVSLIISLALILQIVNEAYVQKLQKEQLFSRQKEMQLKILSNQINPHFLYNTLETIRMMAQSKKETEIAATIKMLSQILRQTLSVNENTVPLATEIDLVRNYLSIQKLRFGSRMDYSIEVDDNANGSTILPLLIQPLAENSLIHGLETKQGGGFIKISVAVNDNTLYIDVTDNGIGIEQEKLEKLQADLLSGEEPVKGHIGLVNVNRRIKLHYGSSFGLTISAGSESGINVRMVIPLAKGET